MFDKHSSSKGYLPRVCLLFGTACCLILFITGGNAFAANCGGRSPSFANGKSPFDEMKIRHLTETEQNILKDMFKSLHGRWKGTAQDIDCNGRLGEYTREIIKFTTKTEVKADRNGNLRLETQLYSEERHSRHTEVTAFYLVDNKLRFENDSGAGDVEIINISDNSVQFRKRLFISSGLGSLMREIFVTLSSGEGTFTLQMSFYSQGFYSGDKIRTYTK